MIDERLTHDGAAEGHGRTLLTDNRPELLRNVRRLAQDNRGARLRLLCLTYLAADGKEKRPIPIKSLKTSNTENQEILDVASFLKEEGFLIVHHIVGEGFVREFCLALTHEGVLEVERVTKLAPQRGKLKTFLFQLGSLAIKWTSENLLVKALKFILGYWV